MKYFIDKSLRYTEILCHALNKQKTKVLHGKYGIETKINSIKETQLISNHKFLELVDQGWVKLF